MAEALAKVKRHFGRDALILSTRTISRRGLLGLGARSLVEITAAPAQAPSPARTGGRSRSPNGATPESSGGGAASPVRAGEIPWKDDLRDLKALLGELLRETRQVRSGHLPAGMFEVYRALVQRTVAEDLALQLVERVERELPPERRSDPQAVRDVLLESIRGMIPTAGPIRVSAVERPLLVALVGPTGVGKTTTIAKLAANFCLRDRKRVGLITLDTYRIAAVEQLRTYARIIDVPLEVASTPAEYEQAVRAFADCDVVLIDTAGRSQRDHLKMRELKEFFDRQRPHEVHLVLSTAASPQVLGEAVERFSGLGVDRVIFTKLDEAIGFGVILQCLERARLLLSYVTTGQDVPDDIEVGDERRLAEMILSGFGEGDGASVRPVKTG